MSIDVIAGAAAGPFAVACVLLGVAGASKLRRPAGTGAAAAALGLPAGPGAMRALGAVEAAVAIAGLTVGGIGAAAVAVMYVLLAISAARLLVRSPSTPCGCIDASTAPVNKLHIAVNVAAAIAAALAIGAGSPLTAVGSSLWLRVAFPVLVACGAWLVALMLDALPELGTQMLEGGTR